MQQNVHHLGTNSNHDATESDDESTESSITPSRFSRANVKLKVTHFFSKLKKDIIYTTYHKTKGRSYFCEHTCSYWGMTLFWLIVLYCVLAGLFIAYMSIASEMIPFTFFYYKSRDPSTIPTPPTARVYFPAANTTNSTTA